MKQTHLAETIPFYLGKLDEIATKNGGYLVGERVSYFIRIHFTSVKLNAI